MIDNNSLFPKVVRGGAWIFGLRAIDAALGFLRIIVLARLLAPRDFGLFGVALLALSILESFSKTGFDTAIIQRKDDVKGYLDTVWTVQIIRGFILGGILFFGAPLVADFFKEPAALLLVRILAFSELLKPCANIGVIYFKKELQFNKVFVYSLAGTLVSLAVVIPTAFILRSVWALVLGLFAGQATTVVVSYFIHPYRPRIVLDVKRCKELFSFGKWITVSWMILFLVVHGDDIFVGRLLGAAALGFYQMAYRISNISATEIAHVISQVTFPAYAKFQEDIQRLKESYLRILDITLFLTVSMAAAIFVLIPDFTRLLLGEKWMPMVPTARILVFYGLLRAIAASTGPVFVALGRPKVETAWQGVRLLVLVLLIYPLTISFGLEGTALAVFFSMLISWIGFSVSAVKITKCPAKQFIKVISCSFVNGAVIIAVITLLKNRVIQQVGLLDLALMAGLICAISVFSLFILESLFKCRTKTIIKDIITGYGRMA